MYHGDAARHPRMVGRAEVVGSRPDLDAAWDEAERLFPVRITRSFWDRVDPDDPHDPLAAQIVPDPRELAPDVFGLADPVGDAAQSPVPWVVRKYVDRVLWMVTKRCHLHCRYCFRRDHAPGDALDPTEAEWAAAVAYVRGSGAREVVLSGGDPLAIPAHRLFAAIDAVRDAVDTVRIHTRAPITYPDAVTDALVGGLRARGPVWVVVHCNHPRELAPEVDRALANLVDAGIPVLNQAVLLQGVNDDPDVLADLTRALVRRRVLPYYLHVTDRVPGTAHFRVDVARGVALHEALRARTGGTALPRLVIDAPDGSGKVDAARWTG